MSRQATGDTLLRLLSSLKSAAPHWYTSQTAFERRETVRVERSTWHVGYMIHVSRQSERIRKAAFEASITLFPPRIRRDRQGWHSRLVAQKWYPRCDRELARFGYRGRWHRFSWGRLGSYWKKLARPEDAAAELARLERAHFETRGGPSLLLDAPSTAPDLKVPADGQWADLLDILNSFAGLESEWSTAYFDFQKNQPLTFDGTRWSVTRQIHGGWGRSMARIIMGPSPNAPRTRGGWHPRLLKHRWYRTCTDELLTHGYRGSWWPQQRRRGLFLKRLKDRRAAAAELRRLDNLEPLRKLVSAG